MITSAPATFSPADRVLAYRLQGAGRRRRGAKAHAAELLKSSSTTRRSAEFIYESGPLPVADETDYYIRNLGLTPVPEAAAVPPVRPPPGQLASDPHGFDHAAEVGTRCQARSNAVPWATLVRTIGRPSVTFTAVHAQ